ncbi:MAG TPA: hypothetical protein VLE23_06215 [Geminicoccaceae bacterium]|nr:hypothetical protein [Geminicoccaceae bacterium]
MVITFDQRMNRSLARLPTHQASASNNISVLGTRPGTIGAFDRNLINSRSLLSRELVGRGNVIGRYQLSSNSIKKNTNQRAIYIAVPI